MTGCRGFEIRWESPTLAELHARALEAYVGRKVRGSVGFEARVEREIRKLIARPTPPWGRGKGWRWRARNVPVIGSVAER